MEGGKKIGLPEWGHKKRKINHKNLWGPSFVQQCVQYYGKEGVHVCDCVWECVWKCNEAQSAAYLYHADILPQVFHHFTSLLTGCTVTGAPCDSQPLTRSPSSYSIRERPSPLVWSPRNTKRAIFAINQPNAEDFFSGHTGESHFAPPFNQIFQFTCAFTQ